MQEDRVTHAFNLLGGDYGNTSLSWKSGRNREKIGASEGNQTEEQIGNLRAA